MACKFNTILSKEKPLNPSIFWVLLGRSLPIFFLLLLSSQGVCALPWGFFAHKKINELAIYTLPPELQFFFKANKDLLIEGAVRPDQRRYSDPEEAPKHYIDLDTYPLDSFPSLQKPWNEVGDSYGYDHLYNHSSHKW